jgi:hypothetical protein
LKKLTLFPLLIIIAFWGCQKEASDTTDPVNYLSFTMGDQSIRLSDSLKSSGDSLGAIYINGVSDSSLSSGAKVYGLVIAGSNKKTSSAIELLLDGLKPITTGTYNLVDSALLNNPLSVQQTLFYSCGYANAPYTYTNESDSSNGFLQLTSFDVENKVIEGTFQANNLEKWNKGGAVSGKGSITNGKFRMRMIVEH